MGERKPTEREHKRCFEDWIVRCVLVNYWPYALYALEECPVTNHLTLSGLRQNTLALMLRGLQDDGSPADKGGCSGCLHGLRPLGWLRRPRVPLFGGLTEGAAATWGPPFSWQILRAPVDLGPEQAL